ncbi:uncharacterized protein THITE_2092710 [Thermothielavioides terrestris NRRL 8126]|uniref:Uncharacterized protein n=1 Tax=Thermothielavioides terrestris (strain ATCC 38088 / NRRL 8126) TaxID=578455 RepID=G2RH93_THETT|nr:uncharacterized protein THITE_2092710 [Thermothielavioides terrestris NRRL 8126]AEO71205.1 hypothetical protein THITE_2092710 [Thermothielavioides terrestris NRRL 8126]
MRWQRLGTWNPTPSDPRPPINRAGQLRKSLEYGERPSPPPRSPLQNDASTSEAECFIISRFWFIYSLECNEFARGQIASLGNNVGDRIMTMMVR